MHIKLSKLYRIFFQKTFFATQLNKVNNFSIYFDSYFIKLSY